MCEQCIRLRRELLRIQDLNDSLQRKLEVKSNELTISEEKRKKDEKVLNGLLAEKDALRDTSSIQVNSVAISTDIISKL